MKKETLNDSLGMLDVLGNMDSFIETARKESESPVPPAGAADDAVPGEGKGGGPGTADSGVSCNAGAWSRMRLRFSHSFPRVLTALAALEGVSVSDYLEKAVRAYAGEDVYAKFLEMTQ